MTDLLQGSLFDPGAPLPHRQTDPLTSRIAARSVDLAARKSEVVDAMRYIGVSCTASEIAAVLHRRGLRQEVGAVRSRLNQLRKDDGKVRKVGHKTVPKPTGTGRPEQTWWLT